MLNALEHLERALPARRAPGRVHLRTRPRNIDSPDLLLGGQHHVVEHRHLGQHLGQLERAHHALRRPACTTASPLAGWPSNTTAPLSGLSKPVSRLKNVVLPAPFGPDQRGDRAALDLEVVDGRRPGCRRSERVTSSATRIGSGLATPGVGSTPSKAPVGRVVPGLLRAATPRRRHRPSGRTTIRRPSSLADIDRDLPSCRRRCPAAGTSSAA